MPTSSEERISTRCVQVPLGDRLGRVDQVLQRHGDPLGNHEGEDDHQQPPAAIVAPASHQVRFMIGRKMSVSSMPTPTIQPKEVSLIGANPEIFRLPGGNS